MPLLVSDCRDTLLVSMTASHSGLFSGEQCEAMIPCSCQGFIAKLDPTSKWTLTLWNSVLHP